MFAVSMLPCLCLAAMFSMKHGHTQSKAATDGCKDERQDAVNSGWAKSDITFLFTSTSILILQHNCKNDMICFPKMNTMSFTLNHHQ